MPGAISYIAGSIWVYLGATTGAAIVAWGVYIGLSVGLMAGLSKIFGPKIPNINESLAAKSVTRRSGIEYRKIVYGQAITSGPVFYNNVSGDDREYLWTGVSLCEGPIEDVVSVWLDRDEIPEADIAWAAGLEGAQGTGSGYVSTSEWVNGADGTKSLQIYYGFGHPDQVALAPLVSAFSEWTTTHRLRGIAYVVVKMLYNEQTEKIWRAKGQPGNIKAVVKGKKIYDPRRDSTQIIDEKTSPVTYGSGAHRLADSDTWEWSENPALCIADYLVNYMNVSTTVGINWTSIANAADDCNVLVAIPPSASPENTQKRFTCNGIISMGSSHKDNLDTLLSSCDGKLSYTGGEWYLRASVWEASSSSFDEDDLAGPVEIRGSAPRAERFNTVRGVIVDPNKGYGPTEFPISINSTYVTRDNEVTITRDLELGMTNSAYMAQRIGFRLLEQANNQIIVKIKTNARGAKAAVGDVISLTVSKLSWTDKTFRVIEWQRNEDGTFDMTLREDDAASYADPIITDYTLANSASVTIPSAVVPPPTGLSASTVPYGIKLSWTNPATKEFDFIDVYVSSTSAWSGATKVASVNADTYTHSVGNGQTRYFWLRCRRNNGDVSVRIPDSDTSNVSGTSSSGTDSVQLVGATLTNQLITSNDAEVSYRLASTGEEQSYEGDGGTHTDIVDWLLSGTASNFECRLTVNSGDVPACDRSPGVGVWLGMGTTSTWTLTDSGSGALSNNCTIEIRDTTASPMTTIASATVTMAVEKQGATVSLSGTAGTPNVSNVDTVSPTNAVAGWKFLTNGTIQRLGTFGWTTFASGVEWIDATPPATYYIRASNSSGEDPDSGPALDTWHSLASEREWTWTDTTAGAAGEQGTLKIEIATTASPPDIVATGYYKGFAFKELNV